MIDYLASFINTNGAAFPNTEAVNATGPAATDGTEFVKLMIDDEWGARQALMDYAGLIPDGVTEAPGTSQFIEAIQKGFGVGPGMGVIYWKDGDPAVNGDRVLLLNGQGVLRSSFQDLDAAVYVGDPDNGTASAFYHADDAAGTLRNTAGIYLILPDTRGYTLRGLDVAAAVDPDGASRDLGSSQLDASQGHQHTLDMNTNPYGGGASISAHFGATGAPTNGNYPGIVKNPSSDGINGVPRISSESRMVNIATRYGITY